MESREEGGKEESREGGEEKATVYTHTVMKREGNDEMMATER